MVAPFLGPLKGWIKQQRKLDQQKAKEGAQATLPVAVEAEKAPQDTIVDETPASAVRPDNTASEVTFADLIANLGRNHKSSDTPPEVTGKPETSQIADPAAELKRLLSVGGGLSAQPTPTGAPTPTQRPMNMTMHEAHNRPSPPYPQTPRDQFVSTPPEPQSPYHQNVGRQSQLGSLPPPPPFHFQPHPSVPYREIGRASCRERVF